MNSSLEQYSPQQVDYQELFRSLAVPAAVLDGDFRFITVNPAFEAQFGYQRAKIVREPFVTVFDPALADTVRHNCSLLRALTQPRHTSERKVRTRSGRMFDALVQMESFDSGGRRNYSVQFSDVQAARERERMLFSRGEMFRLMIEQSPMPISIQDSEGRFRLVNEAYCALVGYSEAELLERDPADFLHPPQVREQIQNQRQAILGSNLDDLPRFTMVRTLIHRDGRHIPYRLELGHTRGVDGAILWCSTLIDLSRLETARLELDAQTRQTMKLRSRFETYLECADQAVVVFDAPSQRILHANSSVLQVLGVSKEELQYQDLRRLWSRVHAGDRAQLVEDIGRLKQSGRTEAVVRVRHADADAAVRIQMFRSDSAHTECFVLAETVPQQAEQGLS